MAESWRFNKEDKSRERDQAICGWYTNDSWAVVSNCDIGHSSRLSKMQFASRSGEDTARIQATESPYRECKRRGKGTWPVARDK